ASFRVDSDTSLKATVPDGAGDGPISVQVGGGEAKSPDGFSVITIADFSPPSGTVGSPLTIDGAHLDAATSVKVGAGAVDSFVVSPDGTQIKTTVPNTATNGRITVETPYGTAASPGNDFSGTFHVVPTVTSLSPMIGTPGTTVTVNGTGLRAVSAVSFGEAYADASTIVINGTGTQLTVSAPEGSGHVGVHTGLTDGYSAQSFTLFWIRSAYQIPNGGELLKPGDSVLIDGANLQNASSIKFNGTPAATFSYGGDGRITAVVPNGFSSGPLSITTPLGTTTSSFNLIHMEVTGFSPTSGPAGTKVTVTGVGFQDPSMAINFLSFFGRLANDFTVDSDIKITVTEPADAFTGPIQIFTTQGVIQSSASF